MKYFLVTLFICISSLAFSQGKASLGAEAGFPTGSGTDGVGTGFGGSFRYEAPTKNKNLNWLVSIGYLSFPLSAFSGGVSVTGNASFLPILFGLKYYPNGSFNGFYFGGDMGVSIINEKLTISGNGFNGSGSGSDNKFTFSPGVGYHFKGADLGFKYNVISDANYISIRLGVVLN